MQDEHHRGWTGQARRPHDPVATLATAPVDAFKRGFLRRRKIGHPRELFRREQGITLLRLARRRGQHQAESHRKQKEVWPWQFKLSQAPAFKRRALT
jgi:hypothetical protein